MSGRSISVGLNLVYLVPGETGGMETYARELIPALEAAAPAGTSFVAFVNREAAEGGGEAWGESVRTVTVPVRARRRAEWVRGEQQHLPRLAAREGVDLLHSLGNTAPVWGRTPRVLTVHDLIYHRFPGAHPMLIGFGMRSLVPLAVRRSRRVIADSASTREDLVGLLGVDPDLVDVVPLGLGRPAAAEPEPEARIRERLGLGDRPVVLSVSAKRPHKNLVALIEAMAILKRDADGGGPTPVLIVPGYPTDHERELRARAAALGLGDDVRFQGWVAGAALEGLYALADVFVFPSLYEGFGLPVLEAMARGVPVACANRSSLPEIAGDAALTFDPERAGGIADAIRRLLSDPAERDRLRALGLRRAETFSWERTARGTLASYERALGAPGSS